MKTKPEKPITDPMRCTSCQKMVELEWFRRLRNGKPYSHCIFCEAVDQPTVAA